MFGCYFGRADKDETLKTEVRSDLQKRPKGYFGEGQAPLEEDKLMKKKLQNTSEEEEKLMKKKLKYTLNEEEDISTVEKGIVKENVTALNVT